VTPTPSPVFSGVANIYEVYNGMDGWGWVPNTELTVEVRAPDGTLKDSLSIVASVSGNLPWTNFRRDMEELDWLTLRVNGQHTEFPLRMVRGTADPKKNTIVGVAQRYVRVTAMVEHPAGTYTYLETVAGPDGHFSFDFSSRVDWDYGDHLWVGQYLNANGLVQVTEDSPQLQVTEPRPEPVP